jgi:hypothetical protein
MISKNLFWLLYLVPYTGVLSVSLNFHQIISDGFIEAFRFALTCGVVLVGYLYAFGKHTIIHPSVLKLFFLIAIIDELLMSIEIFSFSFAFFSTYLMIAPSFVLLWLSTRQARNTE